MKIVDVKTAVVAYHGEATLVRIDTDEGLSGYGEANPDAGAGAIVGLISELKAELIGEDPRNVEYCWEKLRRNHVFSGPQGGRLPDRAQRHRDCAVGPCGEGRRPAPLPVAWAASSAIASASMPIAAMAMIPRARRRAARRARGGW